MRHPPMRARYDAAQTTDDNRKHWAWADAMSAEAAMDPMVRRILRNRSRYECANNSYAAGIIQTLANDTIGTGPTLQMLTGNTKANETIEWWFGKWAREIRLPAKLRTMTEALHRDGEAFAIMTFNPRLRSPVKLGMRLIEADQVASLNLAGATPTVNDGIIYGDDGELAATATVNAPLLASPVWRIRISSSRS